MTYLWLHALLAGALVALAGYAQLRVGRFTKGSRATWSVRLVLGAVGVMFGLLLARLSPDVAALAFVQGFGVVHVPAAAILWLKQRRGEGRS